MKAIWKLAMTVAVVALCADGALAQRRGASGKSAPDQMIRIREISGVGGDSDYTTPAPQADAKWKKRINHTDSYTKDDVKGWHYFEVAYQVANIGTDSAGAKKPILAIPEVEITYALLYDMTKSKRAATVARQAKQAGGAIGWDNPRQLYSLFTETITYTSITPGREHYAAVCVPPASVSIYGEPMVFSVQIKVNGIQQGEIMTELAGGAKIDGKDLQSIMVEKGADGKAHMAAWWERIENLSDSVVRRDGILRDRSMTPFVMAGDQYYDQVKAE